MMSKYLRWIAFYIIIENGLLYFVRAQTQYDKAAYLGYLATGSFVLSFLAALFIYKKFFTGWVIGLVTSIGSIAGYVLTRTVALPGLAIEPWNYPYGILSSAVSGLFILLFLIAQPWKSSNMDAVVVPQKRSFFKRLLPLTGLILVLVVSLGAYQWDRYAFEAGYHVHVGSLGAVCRTPLTTFDELEETYGLRLVQMNITMLDSAVDVRLMIVDAEKAEAILDNQAALLVDQEVLILAPHQHSHGIYKAGVPHIMFFSTQNNTIQSGSEVSLVLGKVRVEPVTIP